MTMEISIEKTKEPRIKPDQNNLVFGNDFTDHMFLMDYTEEKGWHSPRIVPYGPLNVAPSLVSFHYGQTVFEGLKAYKSTDGRVLLFRPRQNMERLNRTNERLCIPQIDVDFCITAIKELVSIDRDWIPDAPGTSLYIRPFIIATDKTLKLKPSSTYQFIIILSPVGNYYPQGINPVNIYVETEYVRSVPGGTGFAKFGGNYAASLKAQARAAQKGYVQVLWLDGIERKYIEEVGSMNVFFKVAGTVITPALEGSILPGITRDSVIKIVKSWDIPLEERKISIQEIYEAHQKGILEEVFGTGTAAVISPIGELNWKGKSLVINNGKTGDLAAKLYDTITGIQTGKIKDDFDWVVEVN